MRLTVETRLEVIVFILAASLIISGIALIYWPAAFVVAGLFLLASLVDLRRTRP